MLFSPKAGGDGTWHRRRTFAIRPSRRSGAQTGFAEALADELAGEAAGQRFLLARASRGREVLAERLIAAGGAIEQIVVYTSADATVADAAITSMLRAGKIAWVTVTSSAISRSLARLFGEDLHQAKLASISPITSDVLRQLGFEPTAEAVEYTLAGLAASICDHSAVHDASEKQG